MDTLSVITAVTASHWLAYKWGYFGLMGHLMWWVFKRTLNFERGRKPKPRHWRHALTKWAFSLSVYWFLIVLWKESGLQWLFSWATDNSKLLEPWAAGPITPYSVMLAFAVHPFLMLVFNALARPNEDSSHPLIAMLRKWIGGKK